MHPYIHLFGLSIPSYGIMTALAYGAGLYYCYKYQARLGLPKDKIFDLIFWLIIGALIGGKIFYIWFNYDAFAAATLVEKIRFGFVFYGGFIGGFIAGFIWMKKYKQPMLPAMDFFAVPLALGHAIGRIGCFLAGCCYGKIAHNFLGVKYTDPESLVPAHLHDVSLYPVQLMESILVLILFFILFHFYNKMYGKNTVVSDTKGLMGIAYKEPKQGVIFAGYLLGYGIIRFALEYFRFDDRGAGILGMSPSQTIAVILIIISVFFFTRKENNAK